MTDEDMYEIEALELLLEDLYVMYGKLSDFRTDLRTMLGHEESEGAYKEFRRLEGYLSKGEDAIRGRLQELDEDYCLSNDRYNQKLAKQAKAAGVNCVALSLEVPQEDRLSALGYIVQNGLASMNYDETCQALEKFREEKMEEMLSSLRSA